MTAVVVLAAGGTAGHVNPMLATARAVQRLRHDVSVVIIGTEQGLEHELVPAAGFELQTIPRVPFPRSLSCESMLFPVRFRRAVARAQEILLAEKADVVIGFGGYVSTPVYLAARKLGIPVVIHEGNARPGLANKLGARFSRAVALTFSNTPLKSAYGITKTIGLPMREDIVLLASDVQYRADMRRGAAQEFGLDPDHPIVVVTGGSQGAQHINEVMSEAAEDLLKRDVQILHLTGRHKSLSVLKALENMPENIRSDYIVYEYLEQMEKAYALADLVITRAGAGMVCEVAALGIPAVFVPFPIGNGEQALNAHDVVHAGGALLVSNQDFDKQWVNENVIPLFDAQQLAQMADKAKMASALDAAYELAQLALKEIASR